MPASSTTTAFFGTPAKSGMRTEHESVLVQETIAALDLSGGLTVLDATAGQGGHSEAILRTADVQLIAMDADPDSVAASAERLKSYGSRARIIEANFRDMQSALSTIGVTAIDRALFDLGWNRNQLSSGKGFSFQGDDVLNMSYGTQPTSGFTAAAILNTWSEEAIANVLFGYGGERYARRIAKNVAEARGKIPLQTTGQLVAIIERSVPAFYRHPGRSRSGLGGRAHCATKSFQALRIAVNDELGSLTDGLRAAWAMLNPGGRIAVITFHSLEDGLVKKLFAEFAAAGGTLAHKKPLVPSREEVLRNRAARSAKLRTVIKS